MQFAVFFFFLACFSAVRGRVSLYNNTENVVEVWGDNSTHSLSESNRTRIVQFYLSWCGHCQTFASTFKEFVYDIKGWTSVVEVNTVACSETENKKLCQYYKAEKFPEIRFFPPNANDSFLGLYYSGNKTVDALRGHLVKYIEELTEDEKPDSWPDLKLQSNRSAMVHCIPPVKCFLIVEDGSWDHQLSIEIILDLSDHPRVHVLRVPTKPNATEGLKPAVYSVSFNNVTYLTNASSRAEVVSAIRASLPSLNETTDSPPLNETSTEAANVTLILDDGLHLQDMESVMAMILRREVPRKQTISGRVHLALKTFLYVLGKHYPGKRSTAAAAKKLFNWMKKKDSITAAEWKDALLSIETPSKAIPKVVKWTGCRGSESHLRGYPCGLWMLFHSMTVDAVHQETKGKKIKPIYVLWTMKLYIRHFFGCRECAEHFVKMTKAMTKDNIRNASDAVMWLWNAHNLVNERLKGKAGDDPLHPKQLFPTVRLCSECETPAEPADDGWNREEVLKFLCDFYQRKNVIQDEGKTPKKHGKKSSD